MKEIVYELEEFRRIAERERADLSQVKINFPFEKMDKDGLFARLTGKLSLPIKNRILICEFEPIVINGLFYENEIVRNEKGTETERVNKYIKWCKDQVREKLGIEPTFGRWEP